MATGKRTRKGSRPGARWARPVRQIVEIALSAPIVIGHRAARIVTGGWPPRAPQRREYRRMVQEKVEGLGLAVRAAVSTRPRDAAAVVGDVLAPIHERVVANRRRLSRG